MLARLDIHRTVFFFPVSLNRDHLVFSYFFSLYLKSCVTYVIMVVNPAGITEERMRIVLLIA